MLSIHHYRTFNMIKIPKKKKKPTSQKYFFLFNSFMGQGTNDFKKDFKIFRKYFLVTSVKVSPIDSCENTVDDKIVKNN